MLVLDLKHLDRLAATMGLFVARPLVQTRQAGNCGWAGWVAEGKWRDDSDVDQRVS